MVRLARHINGLGEEVMQSVELRWNNGVLEYRALILHERTEYIEGQTLDKLTVDWGCLYTDWTPVPQATN